MILQTMTPEEKACQAKRIEFDIDLSVLSWIEHNKRMLKKRQSYPYTHVIKRSYKNMGEWNIIIEFPVKPRFAKDFDLYISAYQKYYVTRSRKAENIGCGVYFVSRSYHGENKFRIFELTPHYFNRYRERFVNRMGLDDISFSDLILFVQQEIRLPLFINGEKLDKSLDEKFYDSLNLPRYKGYDNFAAFSSNGLSLGYGLKNGDFMCFLTFLGEQDLHDTQSAFYHLSLGFKDLADRICVDGHSWSAFELSSAVSNLLKQVEQQYGIDFTGKNKN